MEAFFLISVAKGEGESCFWSLMHISAVSHLEHLAATLTIMYFKQAKSCGGFLLVGCFYWLELETTNLEWFW